MRWLILFLALVCCGQASAQKTFIATKPYTPVFPPSNICPFGTGLGDGCPSANQNASFQQSTGRNPGDYLNQIAGTATNYVTNGPAWNLAGIDYPVGTIAGTSFLDPATNPIAGCTYFPTGAISGANTLGGNPALNCSVQTGFVGFTGYDFEAQNGHGCINLRIVGSAAVTVNITNSKFKNDGNCAFSGAPSLIVGGSPTSTFNLTNIEEDGNGLVFGDIYGTCTFGGTLACNATQAFSQVSGQLNITYSYLHDFAARPFTYSTSNACCGLLFKYNLMAGADYRDPQSHAEWIISGGNPGGTGIINQYNTWINTTSTMAIGLAPFPSQFVTVNPVPTLTIDHNLIVEAFSGGASQSATMAGSITGSTLTTSSVSAGTVGSGELVTCGAVQLMLVDDGTTAHKTAAGIGGGVHGTTGSTWYGDVFSDVFTAKLDDEAGGTGNVLTVTANNGVAITAGMAISDPGVVTTTVTGPGGSSPGSGGTGTYLTAATAAVHTAATFTGNPPNHFTTGWTANGTVTCSSQGVNTTNYSILIGDESFTEPFGQITNTWNYADLSSAGTGKNIWGQRGTAVQNFCTNPTIWGNNVDMSGLYNSTVMNQFQIQPGGNGC